MSAAAPSPSMADYMEAVAREQKGNLPEGYGYAANVELGLGFFKEERHGCRVLEKPVVVPSGKRQHQGNIVLFGYCCQEGMEQLLEGALPPVLPVTAKEPKEFQSLEEIADNFGNKNPKAAAGNSKFCIPFRVPAELATQADTPGRNLWIIRFDQDLVSPFLQAAKEGKADKVAAGLKEGVPADTVDEHGVSALMMAAMIGSTKTCKVLLNSDQSSVNEVEPKSSRTALMFAAQNKDGLETTKLLLENKADANLQDTEGCTALMFAAVANNAEIAKLLAISGNKDIKNNDGQTAAVIAEKMGHQAAMAVF